MLHVIKVNKYDVLNGKGIRCSIWLSGCNNKCKGCWASNTWNPLAGKTYSEMRDTIEEYVKNPKNDGISILGGDPLYHFFNDNEEKNEVLDLLKMCKSYDKNVWMWTGYQYEEILEKCPEVLGYIDVLIDGKFDIDKKDLKLYFRGSSNQRVIDVPNTMEKDEIVTLKFQM